MKILDRYGIEVAIPSICKPRDTTHVVISTETERLVNEIHNHKAEVRSNNDLHDNIQESKRSGPSEESKVTHAVKQLGQLLERRKLMQALSPLFQKRHFFAQGESLLRMRKVDSYSCSFTIWKRFGSVDFQKGYDNVTSFP